MPLSLPKLTRHTVRTHLRRGKDSMKQPPESDAPHLQVPRVGLSVGAVRSLLLAVVGGGIGCLVWYALQVPAIASEVVGWLGRPTTAAVDTPEGRRSQVIFLLLVYSSPLALGALLYAANYLWSGFSRWRE